MANDSRIIFRDDNTPLSSSSFDAQSFLLKTEPVRAYRPPSHQAFLDARRHSSSLLDGGSRPLLQWQEELVHGPNVSDRETLLALAKMTNNAYVEPSDDEWYDLGSKWKNEVCRYFILLFRESERKK
jgi:lipase ATG15